MSEKTKDPEEIRLARAERKAAKTARKEKARERAQALGFKVAGPEPSGIQQKPPDSVPRRSSPRSVRPTQNFFCKNQKCEHYDHHSPVLGRYMEDPMMLQCPLCGTRLEPAGPNGMPSWYDAEHARDSQRALDRAKSTISVRPTGPYEGGAA